MKMKGTEHAKTVGKGKKKGLYKDRAGSTPFARGEKRATRAKERSASYRDKAKSRASKAKGFKPKE